MEKKILSAKDSALSFVLAFAFSQIAVMVFSLLGSSVASMVGLELSVFQDFLDTALGYFLTMLILDLALIFVFAFFDVEKQNKIVSKPKVLKIVFYACIAIICFFALYPIVACVDNLFVKMGAKLSDLPYDLTQKSYFLSIFSLALVPAVCEELIFRGLIFKGLKRYGKAFSIILSAVMFAIFHMSYQQLLYPFLMGLFLAVIMYYENNIIYTIIFHFTNNFFSLTISYFNTNLVLNHWLYILLAIVLLVAFLAIVCAFVFKKSKREVKEKLTQTEKYYLWAAFAVMIFLWIVINIFNK